MTRVVAASVGAASRRQDTGIAARAGGSLSCAQLSRLLPDEIWSARGREGIRGMVDNGVYVHAYFNNHFAGHKLESAEMFRGMWGAV
jgi:hypothetical protein